jgi:hypothetical protein
MKITKKDVGKKVWHFMYGWGTITSVISDTVIYKSDNNLPYGINNIHLTLNGKETEKDINPVLFWDEIKFEEPHKPRETIEEEIEVCTCYNHEDDRMVVCTTRFITDMCHEHKEKGFKQIVKLKSYL